MEFVSCLIEAQCGNEPRTSERADFGLTGIPTWKGKLEWTRFFPLRIGEFIKTRMH